jgi:hypothetical protein
MNEVLALIVYAFFQEVNTKGDEIIKSKTKCSENLEEITKSNESMMSFFFDEGHTFADVYLCFDRVMQLGVKYLYEVTKDIATLKAEVCRRLKIDPPANSQKNDAHQMQQTVRELLEKAYEEERAKSVISKKCSRIYHKLLK